MEGSADVAIFVKVAERLSFVRARQLLAKIQQCVSQSTQLMSAFGGKANIGRKCLDVRFCPKADIDGGSR